MSFCVLSDTHVYNALVCDHKLTLGPRGNVHQLHLLRVKGALPGGFAPRRGLTAAGLPQAGAAPCGVNPWVSAAPAVLTTVSATGNMVTKIYITPYIIICGNWLVLCKHELLWHQRYNTPAVWLQGLWGRVVDFQDWWLGTDGHLITQELWFWIRNEEARNVRSRRVAEILGRGPG